MTEIAKRDDRAGTLTLWAEDARHAAAIATSLARTPFVPASLRDRDPDVTAANVTAALLTGRELGLEPMAALRSIDLIQGVPALRAMALRAVVLAAGHELWLHESTATRAIVKGRRAGAEHVQESTWTIDRAKGLGLAGKDNWRKQPAAMLIARATAECARLIAPDAILGLAYAAEELADGDDATQEITAEQPAKRTARRRTQQQAALPPTPTAITPQETPPEPEPDFDEAPPEPARMMTRPQQSKMMAGMTELGLSDRDDRLAFTAEAIGRDIASSSELTADEAKVVIDTIERRLSERASS